MSVWLCEDAVLADFDRRHRAGLIFYDDNPEIRAQTVDGYQFELVVTGAISKKPYIKDNGDPLKASPVQKKAPGFSPGSDIDVSGYEICDVNHTHLLAFNKFCMYRPHMLLLTNDGYERQYDQLNLRDFQAAWKTLEALNWNYFMFFNCGKDGGCSRLHKHLQIAPYLSSRLGPWPESSRDPIKAPFKYILKRFDDDLGPKQVTDIYAQMLEDARRILNLSNAKSVHVPHNVVLGRNWILVVPRSKAGVNGAYGNSLGMLGMVSVANSAELSRWLEQGPAEVVAQLGVPSRSNNLTNTKGIKEQESTNGFH